MARGNWEVKHGHAKRSGRAPEYNVWAKMRARCENPNSPDFKNYGGRGITVCERWAEFPAFLEDMGSRPTKDHTIERVDNDAGYNAENCVWATRDVQGKNRRPRALRASCYRGHPMTDPNVYMRPDGKRGCRVCRQINMANFYERQRSGTHA